MARQFTLAARSLYKGDYKVSVSFVKSFLSRAVRGLVVLGAATVVALTPLSVHADNYGSGTYGNDVYGSSTTPSTGGGSSSGGSSSGSSSSSSSSAASSQPASSSETEESTVVETPSGMQVAINLADGQAIPSTGYYITITPLNGEGKSFDKAEIYLDGKLAYSGAPDSTGTLKWLWDTTANPATKVKIVVFGPGSGTTTHEFSVTVSPVESSTSQQNTDTSTPAEAPATDSGWPAWLTWTLGGLGILLLVGFIIWLIARRRNGNQLPPQTPFTPMQ